jgi:hypothetical protein
LVDDAVVEKSVVEVAFARVEFPVTPSVPATERLPEESMVVVALPPKYAVPYEENREVEAAPVKMLRALQVLEVVVPKRREIAFAARESG